MANQTTIAPFDTAPHQPNSDHADRIHRGVQILAVLRVLLVELRSRLPEDPK
jgi:hypothetical protein